MSKFTELIREIVREELQAAHTENVRRQSVTQRKEIKLVRPVTAEEWASLNASLENLVVRASRLDRVKTVNDLFKDDPDVGESVVDVLGSGVGGSVVEGGLHVVDAVANVHITSPYVADSTAGNSASSPVSTVQENTAPASPGRGVAGACHCAPAGSSGAVA